MISPKKSENVNIVEKKIRLFSLDWKSRIKMNNYLAALFVMAKNKLKFAIVNF